MPTHHNHPTMLRRLSMSARLRAMVGHGAPLWTFYRVRGL